MINKDRYHYNPSQPTIRQPSFELYEALDNLRNQPVYVCVIIVPQQSDARQRAYRLRELTHLGQLAKSLLHTKHKHLAQVLEVHEEKERLTLVVEACEFGPATNYLAQVEFLDERLALQLVREVGLAVLWLHQQNIVHSYINIDGVEIDGEGNARLSPKRLVLHKNHLPPEFKLESKRTQKGDVYSLGCILYKMTHGVYPFDGNNDAELNRNIKEGAFHSGSAIQPNFPLQLIVSKRTQELLRDMLQFEPSKRPTVEEVLKRLDLILQVPPSDQKNKKFPKEVESEYFIFDSKQRIQHGPYFKELLFTGISRSDQELVRVKVIPISKEQDEMKMVYAFISKLDFFKNEGVRDEKKAHLKDSFVHVREHFFTSNSLIVIMEYYNQGTLAEHESKRKQRGVQLSNAVVDELMLYCAEALELYTEEIEPYCWLDPHSILISEGKMKIDLPPLQFQPVKNAMSRMMSTPDYIAPEKKQGRPTETSDVWSVAAVKYWLLTGEFPEFDRDGQYKVPRKKNLPPNENLFFSQAMKDNPLKRRLLRDLPFACPPVQRIAGYYGIPESQVQLRNTIESTIDVPIMHSEANEDADLKGRNLRKPLPKKTEMLERFPQMSWLQRFLYRRSVRSTLQKRHYFKSVSERTNPTWRAVCKTICAGVLLCLFFYLYFFLDAGTLLYFRRSIHPLTVPIVDSGMVVVNHYTLLTTVPQYYNGLQFTTSQVRDDMNCVRQLYYDPIDGGNQLLLDNYFQTGSFVGMIGLGYALALLHFIVLYTQYSKMDLARILTAVKENPLNVNQLVRMIMVTLGFSSLMGFHFVMFGSFYMMPISPCVAAPRLPAGRWVFSGKNNYYLLFLIAIAIAYVAILFLCLYDTQRRMTAKTLLPLMALYVCGLGLRGFGGFAGNSFREGWLSLCGVLPQLLQVIVFFLTEAVDIPFWCYMRYKRYRSRNQIRYSQEYSATDSVTEEVPMDNR